MTCSQWNMALCHKVVIYSYVYDSNRFRLFKCFHSLTHLEILGLNYIMFSLWYVFVHTGFHFQTQLRSLLPLLWLPYTSEQNETKELLKKTCDLPLHLPLRRQFRRCDVLARFAAGRSLKFRSHHNNNTWAWHLAASYE